MKSIVISPVNWEAAVESIKASGQYAAFHSGLAKFAADTTGGKPLSEKYQKVIRDLYRKTSPKQAAEVHEQACLAALFDHLAKHVDKLAPEEADYVAEMEKIKTQLMPTEKGNLVRIYMMRATGGLS